MRQPPQQRELTVEEASGLCHFVVTDVAESDGDLEHCVDLRIAAGSAAEVAAALEVAVAWRYVDGDAVSASLALVDRELGLLYGLTHRRR